MTEDPSLYWNETYSIMGTVLESSHAAQIMYSVCTRTDNTLNAGMQAHTHTLNT